MPNGEVWTVDGVLKILAQVDGMVVRAEPGGALIVMDGPILGPHLLQIANDVIITCTHPEATLTVLKWLRLRARAKARGDDISDICHELGVPRRKFYLRTNALALRLVSILNAQDKLRLANRTPAS